jgi:glycosyltransferase involved in cell wall biosynthesis
MIAILIPYYKILFFKETLLSLANQVDKRFHVYICDDNSNDNPKKLLEEFESEFPFTYHKFDENLGGISLVRQWERCLPLLSKEEWVMILGDDDVLASNVIQDFYFNLNKINNLSIDVVRFSTEVIDENNNKISKKYIYSEVENAVDSLMNKLKGFTRSSLSEYVFRKNKFSNYSFKDYSNGLFSDDILILEHSSFKNIFTINSSIIQIRKSKVNLSGGLKLNNRHQSILKFYKTLLLEFNVKFNNQQIDYIEFKIQREIFNHKKLSLVTFLVKYYLKSFQFLKLFKLILIIFVKLPKLIYLIFQKK